MPVKINLALTGDQHEVLKTFLFPGDNKEAVALMLCGRRNGDRRHRLVVREIHEIPYDHCERTTNYVRWSPDYIDPILARAELEHLSVVKIHSHPTGYATFSQADDESDAQILPMLRGWLEDESLLHGSAVMLPNGEVFGRVLVGDKFEPIDCISVAGDDLHFWYNRHVKTDLPGFTASHAQAFDEGTIERLQRLSIAVIGASGTGSPTIEQFVRLGVGEIVAVDDDVVEERNVNRIIHSTLADAKNGSAKVDVLFDAAKRAGLGTQFIPIKKNLWDKDVIDAIAQCDVVFGCMDSIDGRYLLNTIATFYNIPYFDIGIRLMATKDVANVSRISEVCGTIHYIRPGRSSLMSRGLFSMTDVAAAGLARNDPNAHKRQLKDGYIKGVQGRRPAVISVNVLGSSLAVNEMLARIHPYREEPNGNFASVTFSLASMELINEQEQGFCSILRRHVGRGDMTPLLSLLELAERKKS